MHRWIVFFDFDGTITSEETFYGSMLRLNPETLKKEQRAFRSGEVKLRDGLFRIFSETPSEKYPLIEEYIKEVPFRNGFRELLVYLKSRNIPAVVISGGVMQLIDTVLAPYRELIADVYSVYLDLSGECMRLVSEYDDGEELMSKTMVMDRYSYENAICIGDGVTDVQMAKKSTLVFARDDLRAICEKEHLPYTAWDDFHDVLKALKEYGVSNKEISTGGHMIEVEIKAKITDAKATEKSLRELGFTEEQTVNEQDVYFNGNDRDFRKTDEALRIRACKDFNADTESNTLTYKGPKLGSESQTRKELEVPFKDPAKMMAILSALGYPSVLEVRKLRRMYRLGEITACVDHVDSLGDYLELEKLVDDKKDYPEAVGELYDLLSKLGIPKDALTQYSYLEMLMKHGR